MNKILIIVLTAILTTGCDSGVSLGEACDKHGQICEQITPDSWCKAERKAVILANYQVEEFNVEHDKYALLIANENYAKCIYKASLIEHRKLKEKKTFRIDNHERTKVRLAKLAEETKNSTDPDLLFYHWSRFQEKSALKKFLSYEGTKKLETSRLQFNLATYYIKRDQAKTIALLYRSLELVKDDNDILPEIFRTLSTIYLDQKQFKQSYVWLRVLFEVNPGEVNQKLLDDFSKGYQLDQDRLDSIAELTLDKISQGQFKSPRS